MTDNNGAGKKECLVAVRIRRTITMNSRIDKKVASEAKRTKRTVSALIELALENYLGGFEDGYGGAKS